MIGPDIQDLFEQAAAPSEIVEIPRELGSNHQFRAHVRIDPPLLLHAPRALPLLFLFQPFLLLAHRERL